MIQQPPRYFSEVEGSNDHTSLSATCAAIALTTNCCGFTLLYNLFTVINLQTSFIVLYIRLAPIEITNCCGFILLYLYYIKKGLKMPKNTERQTNQYKKKEKVLHFFTMFIGVNLQTPFIVAFVEIY